MTKEVFVTIVKYEPHLKSMWDNFVSEAKNSTFLFRRDFMEYHKERFEDLSVLIFKNNELIALFPANINNNEIHSHQGLSYGGLLVKNKLAITDFFDAVKHLLVYYQKLGVSYIHLKMLPDFYDLNKSHELQYVLFLLKAELVRKDAYYMLPAHKYNLNRNRKRAIRKANSFNFNIVANGSLKTFWNTLLTPNLHSRFGVKPVHTIEEIEKLQQLFPDNIRFYCVNEGEIMRAGVVMFISERVAHFQYSAGDDCRDSGALDLLFSYIMEKYQTKAYISLGSCSENNGQVINKGLVYWKESFGAHIVSQDFYRLQTNNYSFLENVFR